jgi:hypothetical protein
MIQLIHEMTYHLTAINTLSATEGSPHVVWHPWTIVEGSLEGPRIQSRLEGHGSDWMRLGPDGYTRPDVRMQFRTKDARRFSCALPVSSNRQKHFRMLSPTTRLLPLPTNISVSHWSLKQVRPSMRG